jgi:MFS family permease
MAMQAARPLLHDTRFLALWLTQVLSQLAQYAVLFTLLVVVVKLTGSSTYTSLLILSFIVPSLIFGMLAGILVDRWGKERSMAFASALRAAASVLLFFFHDTLWAIYALNLVFAGASQFFNPAVVALIPTLVERERLMAANSIYNFTVTGSQFFGMVFLAPTLIKTAGQDWMFVAAAFLFALSAGSGYYLQQKEHRADTETEIAPLATIRESLEELWQLLRSDTATILAMLHLSMGSTLVLLFVILMPLYMNDILDIPPDNAAFVFAPTGLGALLGLRSLGWLGRRWNKTRIVIAGLTGLAASLIALSLVDQLAELFGGSEALNPAGLSALVTLTMVFSFPMGIFFALLSAPAQTILHERAPAEIRGRVFGSQIAAANAVSLLPLLLVGGITDLVGVSWVLVLIALTLLTVAAFTIRHMRLAAKQPQT